MQPTAAAPPALAAPGPSPLRRAWRLGERLGYSSLYLKLESANPSGTHKDRAALAIVREALALRSHGVTVGTCGNFGVALARLCAEVSLPCRVYVPARYANQRLREMRGFGAALEEVPDTYEHAVAASQRFAADSGFYDANPAGTGGACAIRAYQEIAREILDALGGVPDSVWLASGNGTTLAGIHRGFAAAGRVPRLGAVASRGNSALLASLECGHVRELEPHAIVESELNEPIVAWRAYHCAEALHAVLASGGWAYGATDAELARASALLLETEDVHARPSSAGALAGLAATPGIAPDGVHVIVLTS